MSDYNYRIRYIYLITNNINKKNYVGKHLCPKGETIETDKYMGSGVLLRKAIRKYGIKNFSKEILATCFDDKILNILEVQYIALYKSIGKAEYNISKGGDGGCWYYMSEEQKIIARRNLSKALKGRVFSEEWKRHISEGRKGEKHPNWGKHLSEELKRKIAEGNRGKVLSEECRKKISLNNKSGTPEVKEKLRKANLGKHLSEETKRKLSEKNKGKIISEKQRKKLSLLRLGKKLNFIVWNKGKKMPLEFGIRMSKALKGRKVPKETLLKRSETIKGAKWWTNGVENHRSKECPGEGWELGRCGDWKEKASKSLKGRKPSSGSKGMKWYNNGIVQTMAAVCPQGFVKGRLSYAKRILYIK